MRKSLSILLLTFLLIVVLRLAGITYGYYTARIVGNTNNTSLSVTSKNLNVEYSDGTSIMNFKGDYLFPGDSAEKLWTVKNNGDDVTTYNVLVDNVSNEFTRIQDLRYELYLNNEMVSSGAINNNLKQYLYLNKSINVGETDNLRLVFLYAETEEVQNIDMNKTISFRVNIDSNIVSSLEETDELTLLANNDTLNNYRIYGQSLQSSTPSGSYVDILEVGDKTSNIADLEEVLTSTNTTHVKFKKDNETGTLEYLNNPTTYDYGLLYLQRDVGYEFEVGKTYYYGAVITVSGKSTSNATIVRFGIDYTGGSLAKSYTITENKTFNATGSFTYTGEEAVRLLIHANYGSTEAAKVKFENIYVSEVDEFEPFNKYKIPVKVNDVTTNIYLDEPLRGIDDYFDYIDFAKQSVVRQVKKIEFTGEEQFYVLNSNPYPYTYYVLGDLGLVVNDMALSSHFALQTNFSYAVAGSNVFRVLNSTSNNQSRIVFRIVDETGSVTDVSKIKTLFNDAYSAGNPYTFYYVSSEEEEKYINLPTINIVNGTNQINVNTTLQPSGVYLEYYK